MLGILLDIIGLIGVTKEEVKFVNPADCILLFYLV